MPFHDLVAELRVAPFQQVLLELRRQSSLAGLAVLSIGAVFGLVCVVWAIVEGVPAPIAIMAGYCTCVTSACLCALLRPVRSVADKPVPSSTTRLPNYEAWRLVATLRVADAARLWTGVEPGCPASQEAIAWAQAMLDAIKRGELPVREQQNIIGRTVDQERANPGWHTEITREGLKTWAQSHGHRPPFLLD
jgi:hypothetical protein